MVEIEAYRDARTRDIIETILFADSQSGAFINKKAAQCLRGVDVYETLGNVWAFVKYNIRYRPDKAGHERVKSPGALVQEGIGDCKSFSILGAALLRALNIHYRFRFTAYEPGDFTHVYLIAEVNGKLIPIDSVYNAPFKEEKYYKYKDYMPRVLSSSINGLPAQPGVQGFTISLPLVILVVAAGYLILKSQSR